MKRILLISGGLASLSLLLSACGHDRQAVVVTPPAPPAAFSDQFGATFSADFKVSPNSEPKDIASGDITAVSLTAEPVNFPS